MARELKAKTKPNDAAVIAKEQNKIKVYTVFGDWDASATTSGKAWTAGQKLETFEDKADFYGDLASGELGDDDKPLALSKRQVVDVVNIVLGDNEKSQGERVEQIIAEHNHLRPLVNVAISETAIDPNIETLAAKLAPALGADLDKGWESAKVMRYIAAELAHTIQNTLTEEEIEQIPPADNTRPGKEKIGSKPNARYNRGYRGRVQADRGPPSWIGDLYDRMPDVGSFQLGASLLVKMNALDPEKVGAKILKKKDMVAGDKLELLYKQRTNGVLNLTDACRLMQRMSLLNSFSRLSCEFKTKDNGDMDLQNMSPIKVMSFANGKAKPMTNIGFVAVKDVLSWDCEQKEKDASPGNIMAKKVRDNKRDPIDSAAMLVEEFKFVADWFNPSGSRFVGKVKEFETYLFKTTSVGDDAGLPADQEMASRALWMARLLAPHLPALEAINTAINEKDKDKRADLIEKSNKFKAAMEKAGHKAA